MVNPFEGYRITSPYGWRIHPVYGDRRFHTGIDLVKGHQEPIYAFAAGEVVFAGAGVSGSGFGNYGNVVAVKDDRGYLHCYCHLDSVVVRIGGKVERGQMIGRQGNTGVGTGSHLHYEVRKRSTPSYGWVADAEDRAFEPTQYLVDLHTPPIAPVQEPEDDVSDWAREARDWAVASDITDGSRPKEAVTREEVWTMLHRMQK